MMIETRLGGRAVLITGGNRGIGAATARAFAAQGASVFITYLRLRPDDDEMTSAAWEADLSDPESIPALFDRAERAFGPVEVLVNNAAHAEADTFLPQSTAGPTFQKPAVRSLVDAGSHDRHFAVNSRGVALMTAEYARRYLARGAQWGRIINVSTDGASGFRGMVSYGATLGHRAAPVCGRRTRHASLRLGSL